MEIRKCNTCGEQWPDSGDYECPFCGSDNTEIIPGDSELVAKMWELFCQLSHHGKLRMVASLQLWLDNQRQKEANDLLRELPQGGFFIDEDEEEN